MTLEQSNAKTETDQDQDINETKTAKIKSKYFDKEKIHGLVYDAVDKTLKNQVYKRDLAKQWIESVTESVMAHLNQYQQQKKQEYASCTGGEFLADHFTRFFTSEVKKGSNIDKLSLLLIVTPEDGLLPVVMKYNVHVVLLKKSPSVGFHSATSAIWDPNTDGMCSVAWENDSMHLLVTVFEVNAI